MSILPKSLFNQVAEITLHYQSTVKPSQRPKVTCSSDAYTIFINHWNPHQLELQEEFKVMLLNRAHKVLGIVNISLGGIAGTIADPKLIYAAALKAGSSSIIAAHSHPSGNLTPSRADLSLTQKLKEAGEFLDLPMQDHLIVTAEGYYSFEDQGVL
ncbi:JAB domain-containing protein [Tunicatimonas pelagia]|uniref:JAB domain-containing protein n=1 Tax=Tunicatimonas pelagia TaxID=931531 RepID=UPI002666C803|nr:JAB domain-containing protein [Tunicatimonas pelagia]WKN44276.1 JAB domain-containing protein [Tunicatimonas pelagia]